MIRSITYLFLLFLTFVSTNIYAQIEAHAILKDSSIQIGDQTVLELRLLFPSSDLEVSKWPSFNDTIIEQIEVIDTGLVNNRQEQGQYFKSQEIIITSFDTGYFVIPPITFYLANDSVQSKPILLEVRSVSIDESKNIKDIKGVLDDPFTAKDYTNKVLQFLKKYLWLFLAIPLLVTAIVLLLVRYLNKKKKIAEQPVEVVKRDIYEKAIEGIEILRKDQWWLQGKGKQHYIQLTAVLWEYLFDRYEFSPYELTSNQIITLFKHKEQNQEAIATLQMIFTTSDLVKFAKHIPDSSQFEIILNQSLKFIEITRLEEEEEESTLEEE